MQNRLMSMREIIGESVSPNGAMPTRAMEAAQPPKPRKVPKKGSFFQSR